MVEQDATGDAFGPGAREPSQDVSALRASPPIAALGPWQRLRHWLTGTHYCMTVDHMKTLCIYHGNCDDGFGAAYAVWKALGGDDHVEFHAGVYQSPPPDVTGRDVIIVDFSYKRPVLAEMSLKAKRLRILDHHKTAAEDLGQDGDPPLTGCEIEFDMDRSGAMMAWDYFNAPLSSRFFAYLQDRDLWTKKLPGVDEFTAALRSYPQDFGVWEQLEVDGVDKLIAEGKAIQRYYRTLVEQAKSHAYRRNIGGHDVPVVNASLFMASEVAGELAQSAPFAAIYAQAADHTIWSLRSRAPDGLDVSAIAKQFGGGGHKHAAGFKIPNELRPPVGLGATGEFPQGSLSDNDEGELRMATGYDPVDGVVRLEFGKPVAWIGLPPPQARALGESLIRQSDQSRFRGR